MVLIQRWLYCDIKKLVFLGPKQLIIFYYVT